MSSRTCGSVWDTSEKAWEALMPHRADGTMVGGSSPDVLLLWKRCGRRKRTTVRVNWEQGM